MNKILFPLIAAASLFLSAQKASADKPDFGRPLHQLDLQLDFGTANFASVQESDDSERVVLGLSISLDQSDLVIDAKVGCGENHLKIYYYDGPMLGEENSRLHFIVKDFSSDTSGCRESQFVQRRITKADFWTAVQRSLAPSSLALSAENRVEFHFWNVESKDGKTALEMPYASGHN